MLTPKQIMWFADGTGNDSANSTHVTDLCQRVEEKRRGNPHLRVGYVPGVGTWLRNNPLLKRVPAVISLAFGLGLAGKVRHGFRFLSSEYSTSDTVYLFGFSRGAFTTRSLATFVDFCGGLLPAHTSAAHAKWNTVWLYQLYRMRGLLPRSVVQHSLTKARSSFGVRPCTIDYIGVWDTVASVGLPVATSWYHAAGVPSSALRTKGIFHALAMDEMRRFYQPVRFTGQQQSLQDSDMPREGVMLKEVWFAGVHSDIGGGYTESVSAKRYSGITLRWMLAQLPAIFPVKTTEVEVVLDHRALHQSHGRLWPRQHRSVLHGDFVHASVGELVAGGYRPVPITKDDFSVRLKAGQLIVNADGCV